MALALICRKAIPAANLVKKSGEIKWPRILGLPFQPCPEPTEFSRLPTPRRRRGIQRGKKNPFPGSLPQRLAVLGPSLCSPLRENRRGPSWVVWAWSFIPGEFY